MPPPCKPPERAAIGVLLVHGIGDHKEGETLLGFGEPMMDWLRDWLRATGSTPARGSVKVSEARLRASRTEAVSPACAHVDIELAATATAAAQSERWLVAEAWWGDSVQPPRTLRLLTWLLTRGPLLIYWHFYLGPLRRTRALSQMQMLLGLAAFMLAVTVQLVVLVAMVLWLIPFGPWRRAVAAAVRALTLTLGDSFVLLEQDFQSAALVRRVDRALDWLGQRATKLIVVAHSQGGAIAHEALRRLRTDRVAAFVSVGSGLEKLHFLRHVRDRRGGLAAASLLGLLVFGGAGILLVGLYVPDRRWLAGLGGVVLVGAVVAMALLINALETYRRDLAPRMAELDLRSALGHAEWHDLHATHDVVPMGEGSMLAGLDFVTRGEVVNQRSYLGDHLGYFENRLGFLPLLWQLLACHSALPLFRAADTELLAAAVRRHGRQAWVLWGGGVANWLALLVGLYALRESLGSFGRSALAALDGMGLGALSKPVRLAGGFLDWCAQRLGLVALPAAGAAEPAAATGPMLAAPLFGVLTVVSALVAWWLLFRAAWLLRASADWRKVCRTPALPAGRGAWAWQVATLVLWAGFGLLSLLTASVFVISPSDSTWQLLTRSFAAVLALLLLGLAALYAIGTPWMMDDAEERLWLPPGALLLAWAFVAGAQWMWPAGFGTGLLDAAVVATCLAALLSWTVWLLLRGVAVYGRFGVLGVMLAAPAVWAVLAFVPELRQLVPGTVGWLLAGLIGLVAAVTAIETVRARALLLQLARRVPPLAWVWPLPKRV
jgi:hypothetical protein